MAKRFASSANPQTNMIGWFSLRVSRILAHHPSSNAIRILNIRNTQVGHLPRGVAADLAPLLDENAVIVDGVILEGNRTKLLPYIQCRVIF